MNKMLPIQRLGWVVMLSGALAIGPSVAPVFARDAPVIDHSRTSRDLEHLPRVPVSKRPVVTIYAFRGSVPGVDADAATDMFTTALIKSGAFVVAERQRLTPDLMVEKQLNAQNMTTGSTAQTKLAGAQYIFEGTVSQTTMDDNQSSGAFSIGGLNLGGSGAQGVLTIDVRVVDANSGVVLDAIDVHKNIRANSKSVSGIGAFAQTVSGTYSPLTPDASVQTAHHDNLGDALRACIEASVLDLVKRYGG